MYVSPYIPYKRTPCTRNYNLYIITNHFPYTNNHKLSETAAIHFGLQWKINLQRLKNLLEMSNTVCGALS